MIEVEHLTKDYGTVVAVRDVSFRVARGEIVGFLGPNGAGKSTTLRIVAGFLGATSGRVRVAERDIGEEPLLARRAIGYMPESSPLYGEMRVREYLRFRAELKRVARRERGKAIDRAMELAAVTDVAGTLIEHLSKGYRQRVGLADALVANPPLLILDEPTAGLDPNQIREVRALVRRLGSEHTIVLSTHILSEVEQTCDRAIVIHQGQLVAEGKIDELRARRRPTGAVIVVRDPEGRAHATIEATPGVSSAKVAASDEGERPGRLRIEVQFAADADIEGALEGVIARLLAVGVSLLEAVPAKASLEDVFAALTMEKPGNDPNEERAL